MSDVEGNKQRAGEFLRLMSAGEAGALGDMLSDNLEYWVAGSMPMSGTHTKATLTGMMGGITGLFPDGLKVRPDAMVAEGNKVAVEASGGGKTASGKTYANRYHFLFEFDGSGKVTKLREYMDTGHAAEIFAG